MSRDFFTTSRIRGFTLTELMVVVGIIAILAAAVVPSFGMTLHKNRQREAANMIVGAVFAARSKAVRTGRCHRVTITLAGSGHQGGSGGLIEIHGSDDENDCGQAINDNEWTLLSTKSVAGIGAAVGLVGDDVAIDGVIIGRANANSCTLNNGTGFVDYLYFEATGGRTISSSTPNSAELRLYRVRMITPAGTPTGVERYVRVSSGGSVRYGLCR